LQGLIAAPLLARIAHGAHRDAAAVAAALDADALLR